MSPRRMLLFRKNTLLPASEAYTQTCILGILVAILLASDPLSDKVMSMEV